MLINTTTSQCSPVKLALQFREDQNTHVNLHSLPHSKMASDATLHHEDGKVIRPTPNSAKPNANIAPSTTQFTGSRDRRGRYQGRWPRVSQSVRQILFVNLRELDIGKSDLWGDLGN